MKSKKIIALIVAFAAFMAVATSGLAAVQTTTTYNTVSGKVEVEVKVTEATPSSEVTYLVKSGDKIVYIDQKTATGGVVDFVYKIDKDKIVDLTTDVKFGTDGDAITGSDAEIELSSIAVNAENALVTFYSDAEFENAIGKDAVVGDGDVIYALVEVDSDYELVSVEGLEEAGAGYKVIANSVTVVTSKVDTTPGTIAPEASEDFVAEEEKEITDAETGETITVAPVVKIFKAKGVVTEMGVEYDGYEYPALKGENEDSYNPNSVYGVRIYLKSGEVVTNLQTYAR